MFTLWQGMGLFCAGGLFVMLLGSVVGMVLIRAADTAPLMDDSQESR